MSDLLFLVLPYLVAMTYVVMFGVLYLRASKRADEALLEASRLQGEGDALRRLIGAGMSAPINLRVPAPSGEPPTTSSDASGLAAMRSSSDNSATPGCDIPAPLR